jgi:hypothetical protein
VEAADGELVGLAKKWLPEEPGYRARWNGDVEREYVGLSFFVNVFLFLVTEMDCWSCS